ncbi:ABC transporter permease [Haladaptatus sp. CMAA 1911]|uniref:ABC transporter permease n=1 Tax=unclassified Haladaptatus TaxID=2622732 RepID=UPI0037543684
MTDKYTNTTFEDINWETQTVSTVNLSKTLLIELACYLLIIALYTYDSVINKGPLILKWDVLSVEWMLAATLVAMFFHGVLPLLRNERQRQFYWQRFKKNKIAVVALCYLIVIFTIGMLGPLLIDPPHTRFTNRILPPVGITATINGVVKTGTWQYPLGTSAKGMGILTLVIYGMRISMEVGLIATIIAVFIGSLVGAVAALATATDVGWLDEVLMRYTDIQSIFPVFMLLLLLVYIFGAKLWMIIALYGIFGWEGIARTVRGEALQRSNEAYISAARASGAGMLYIVRRHLVPNSSNSIIINATIGIPIFILGEATLAFLGFSDPTTFSWGRTISAGQANIEQAWWISTIPGIFLFFTVLSFLYIGEALRDAMDPRQNLGGGGGL